MVCLDHHRFFCLKLLALFLTCRAAKGGKWSSHGSYRSCKAFDARENGRHHLTKYDKKTARIEEVMGTPAEVLQARGTQAGAKELMLLLTLYTETQVAENFVRDIGEVMVMPELHFEKEQKVEDKIGEKCDISSSAEANIDESSRLDIHSPFGTSELQEVMTPPVTEKLNPCESFENKDPSASWAYMLL